MHGIGICLLLSLIENRSSLQLKHDLKRCLRLQLLPSTFGNSNLMSIIEAKFVRKTCLGGFAFVLFAHQSGHDHYSISFYVYALDVWHDWKAQKKAKTSGDWTVEQQLSMKINYFRLHSRFICSFEWNQFHFITGLVLQMEKPLSESSFIRGWLSNFISRLLTPSQTRS